MQKLLPERLFPFFFFFFFLNGRYKRRDEERGLFFHTKQRAKIVNEDGGTASNSSCRKHFLSHSEELTKESGIQRSESLEIGREDSHTIFSIYGSFMTKTFFLLFFC